MVHSFRRSVLMKLEARVSFAVEPGTLGHMAATASITIRHQIAWSAGSQSPIRYVDIEREILATGVSRSVDARRAILVAQRK